MAGPLADGLEANDFWDKIHQNINIYNKMHNHPYDVRASIGIITGIPTPEISLDDFIKAADEEMYKDKVLHHQLREQLILSVSILHRNSQILHFLYYETCYPLQCSFCLLHLRIK